MNRLICSVVITYRAPEKLATCLASLEGQGTHVIVRDNSEDNILYTAGINEGIRTALALDAEYILIVCDDVILRPGAVSAMAAYLDSNPDCGIAMPIQVAASGDVTCGGCTRAFPAGWHVILPLGDKLYETPFESFWANGACFLLRAETVRECGLLDEGMKFICSDSDYSFTVRARGWKIFVVPEARVQHEPDGAMNYKNAFIEKTKDEDSLYFLNKWITGGLYQGLSSEGATLKVEEVNQRLTELNWRLREGYKG